VVTAALLVGGYHGAWLPAAALPGPATRAALAPYGVTPGAGVAIALPEGSCALRFVAGVLTYLAGETARQCGPCVNGLPALAEAFDRMVAGDRAAADRVTALVGLVEGRGGCHHPDGTARLVRSTLSLFLADVAAHRHGRCTAQDGTP
jgi:NADH:ubiquinone oxidoreductase subunit F (NADH-binding)